MGAVEIRSVTRRFSRLVQRGNAGQANMVPYLKRQRSRLITGYILVRGQGEPPDFRRVCIMYNSSYFQRGGANNLTLNQIAQTGGDSYDC